MKRSPLLTLPLSLLAYFLPDRPASAASLPCIDGFESGDFLASNGGRTGGFTVSPAGADSGRSAARGVSLLGQSTDYYQDFYFGDHPQARHEPIKNGLLVRLTREFGSDFEFELTPRYHKILLIKFEDRNALRREQTILDVMANAANAGIRGDCFIENIRWGVDRSFEGTRLLLQGRGAPVSRCPGQRDVFKIHSQPNTLDKEDRAVRPKINGEIKIEHLDISLNKTTYNLTSPSSSSTRRGWTSAEPVTRTILQFPKRILTPRGSTTRVGSSGIQLQCRPEKTRSPQSSERQAADICRVIRT